ncbi:MAG: hypothetical protein EOP88_10770 [Verrucomicrobiaceae bacterium]|nr:MAG: hypothetical protein EOP88_10770 [Verrucomicrobiaceae bacterium]
MKKPSRSSACFSRLALLGFATASAASAQDFLNAPTFTLSEGHAPLNLGSFDIVINAGTGLSGNAAALAAFNRAAQQWEAFFSDPITITIDADMAVLGSGIIGSAGSVTLAGSYNTIRNQMVADSLDEADDSIVSLLPTAAQFTATLAPGSSLDGNVQGNKAALKAAGFTGLDAMFGVSDANITFSTAFSFDFDNSDGVSPGMVDFETVAAHEIGHALGFVSAVDDADGGLTSLSPSMLDLFRFTTAPTSNSQFTMNPRDLTAGGPGIYNDMSSQWLFSTGLTSGDGRQASHWKADELTGNYIGIMDPTLASGVFFVVGYADARALDLIGYDLVPEPSALVLTAVFGAGLVSRRKRLG